LEFSLCWIKSNFLSSQFNWGASVPLFFAKMFLKVELIYSKQTHQDRTMILVHLKEHGIPLGTIEEKAKGY